MKRSDQQFSSLQAKKKLESFHAPSKLVAEGKLIEQKVKEASVHAQAQDESCQVDLEGKATSLLHDSLNHSPVPEPPLPLYASNIHIQDNTDPA